MRGWVSKMCSSQFNSGTKQTDTAGSSPTTNHQPPTTNYQLPSTTVLQTSMKSSAFGFLLAKLHFETFLTRVPSAVSVVWMAITGSALAVMWKYIPVADA